MIKKNECIEIIFDIYKYKDKYVMFIDNKMDSVREDLFRQYGLNVIDRCDDIMVIGSIDDSKNSFIKMINFSTSLDNVVDNIEYRDKIIIVKYFRDSEFYLNDKLVSVPIYGYRNDINGLVNFDNIYPEMLYVKMFSDKRYIYGDNDGECKYILLRDGISTIVMDDGSEIKIDMDCDIIK